MNLVSMEWVACYNKAMELFKPVKRELRSKIILVQIKEECVKFGLIVVILFKKFWCSNFGYLKYPP